MLAPVSTRLWLVDRHDDREDGAGLRAVSSSTRPWCASAIAFTIARPRPAPSERPGPPPLPEPLEDRRLLVHGGIPGPVVADPEPRLAARRRASRSRSVDPSRCSARRSRRAAPSPASAAGGRRRSTPCPRTSSTHSRFASAAAFASSASVSTPTSTVSSARKSGSSRRASRRRSSTIRPIRSSSSVTSASVSARASGLVLEELEMSAHDRQRRLQLVRRVVGEPPLRRERALQPVEHVVERSRELRDLVVAVHGDAAAQVASP